MVNVARILIIWTLKQRVKSNCGVDFRYVDLWRKKINIWTSLVKGSAIIKKLSDKFLQIQSKMSMLVNGLWANSESKQQWWITICCLFRTHDDHNERLIFFLSSKVVKYLTTLISNSIITDVIWLGFLSLRTFVLNVLSLQHHQSLGANVQSRTRYYSKRAKQSTVFSDSHIHARLFYFFFFHISKLFFHDLYKLRPQLKVLCVQQ